MDGTEQRGLKTRGEAEREKLVREEVRGLVGRVKENKGGKIREEEGGSTVSGEKTNKGKSHATYSLRPSSEAMLDMAYCSSFIHLSEHS